MNNYNNTTNSQSNERQSWLILIFRLLGGSIVGYISGFFLLILSETVHPPLLGPVIAGQEELFDNIFFYILYENSGSLDLIHNVSLLVFLSFWGLIGALILSGRRKLVKIGKILLILYVITGCLSYLIWAFRMIPT